MTTLPPMSTHQLLMIEDDVRLAQMVSDYLGNNGLEVTHLADGKSGLERLQPGDGVSVGVPDLVILDLHMPILDGFGAVEALRKEAEFNRTPVMALTASAMMGDRERALGAGFTGYCTKPIRLSALRAEVQRLLSFAQ